MNGPWVRFWMQFLPVGGNEKCIFSFRKFGTKKKEIMIKIRFKGITIHKGKIERRKCPIVLQKQIMNIKDRALGGIFLQFNAKGPAAQSHKKTRWYVYPDGHIAAVSLYGGGHGNISELFV